MKGTWRVVTGLLIFWLLVLMYMSASLYNSSDVNERTERQLAKALQELDTLKQQNDDLQKLASELKDLHVALAAGDKSQNLQHQLEEARNKLEALAQAKGFKNDDNVDDDPRQPVGQSLLPGNKIEPSLAHEQKRRKVEDGVQEFWFYLRSQLKKLQDEIKDNNQVAAGNRIDKVLNSGVDQHGVLMTDLYNLSVSGSYGAWRSKEAADLSDLIQNRLHHLQNPEDCASAKKLVCNMNKGCGYGCQLHHVVYCFLIAYGTQRTFILDSRGWRYSPQGWEKYFQPLSQTCSSRSGRSATGWGAGGKSMDDVQVVELPIIDSIHPRPPYLPQAIPADLAPRIMRLHGHPFVWWVGQFLKYLLRPQEAFAKDMEETVKRLGFIKPIVGVHVRRTDKVGTEAAYHKLDEYMVHVENYYAMLERRQTVIRRRVYLATDDPGLLDEAKKKYPEYLFVGDTSFSRSAGLSSRYSDAALRAIIMDIHFLSMTDYLVCTFSSQVCRVAYEIMQSFYPDATNRFHSLDDIYYFGGQNAHNQVALYDHQPDSHSELELHVGDYVGIAGNHWNGYSKGNNKRTSKMGLYPSYKVAEVVEIVNFPTYPEADKDKDPSR